MQLAISNIAWAAEQEPQVALQLQRLGLTGIEIAPTKVWQRPLEAPAADVETYRQWWEGHGLRIVALQSLLFGRPDLQLFATSEQREAMFEYLCGTIRLAAALGAGALVFGSPKNRQRGLLEMQAAWDVAVPWFRRLGRVANEHGVWFCIEPNPTEYGCDFVVTAAEGLSLVEEVNQPGFGLHLDASGLTMAGDCAAAIMPQCGGWWRHFHISEPQLAPVGRGTSNHSQIAAALNASPYAGWLSIEMKAPEGSQTQPPVASAIDFCRQQYGRGQAILSPKPKDAIAA